MEQLLKSHIINTKFELLLIIFTNDLLKIRHQSKFEHPIKNGNPINRLDLTEPNLKIP